MSSLLPDDSGQVKQQTSILTLLIKARVGRKHQEETEVVIQPLQPRVVHLLYLLPSRAVSETVYTLVQPPPPR